MGQVNSAIAKEEALQASLRAGHPAPPPPLPPAPPGPPSSQVFVAPGISASEKEAQIQANMAHFQSPLVPPPAPPPPQTSYVAPPPPPPQTSYVAPPPPPNAQGYVAPVNAWQQNYDPRMLRHEREGVRREIREEERQAQYVQPIENISPIVPLLPDASLDLSLGGRLDELRALAIDLSQHAQELMQPNPSLNLVARAGSLNSIAAQIVAHIDTMRAAVSSETPFETPAAYGEFGAELDRGKHHKHQHGRHNKSNIIG